MDNGGIYIGFGLLAVGIVVSRLMSERAFQKLDDPMKLAILNEFTGMRIWNVLPVLAIVILMMAGNAVYKGHELTVFGGFVAAMAIYFAITHRMIHAKLIKVQAPEAYVKSAMLARWISYLTILLMLAAMLGSDLF